MADHSCSGSCGSCSSCGKCGEDKLSRKMALIKRKILVLSGKGGVGKSSVAAAIALRLAAAGHKVGLLDADFHGPSQPTIMGISHEHLNCSENGGIVPFQINDNLKVISIGLLMDDADQAIVWRGPVKMGVIKQMLEDTDWGELDDLVLDFPPGTGDEILSACQLIPGEKQAVVVTTPQEVSLADCRKCLDFCGKLELNVRGVVENMSYFVCGKCGEKHSLFASGGGQILSAKYGIPLLAQLPLNPDFMTACDSGTLKDKLAEFPELNSLMI